MNASHLIALRASPAFAGIDDGVVAALAQVFEERWLARGAALARPGQPVKDAFFILEGRVRVGARAVESGPVGVLHLLARDGGGIDARAETDVRLLAAPAAAIFDLLEEHFGFLAGTLQALARGILGQVKDKAPDSWRAPRAVAPPPLRDAPLRLAERILHFRSALVFASSRVEALGDLARVSSEVRITAGQVLWRAGDRADAGCLLVSGEVECRGGFGTLRLGRGDAIGGLEPLARAPRWFDAVAVAPTRMLCTSRDALLDVIEDETDLGVDLVRHLAARLIALREET